MQSTYPGINDIVKQKKDAFQPITWRVIEFFGEIWYITKPLPNLYSSGSAFDAIFVKPTEDFSNIFNIDKELIVLFSTYPKWFPKTLDAFESIKMNDRANRFENICNIVVSNCDNIDDEIKDYLKQNKESQIIVPFSYKELEKNNGNKNYVIDKFRKYFFSRDLFAITSALQKEIYFFGRTDLVHTLVSNYLSSENSGIFGLRKTGKTSILYSTQRAVIARGGVTVWVDCQDTSVYLKRWYQALFQIIKELYRINSIERDLLENDYTIEYASDSFERDIIYAYNILGQKKILIIFDEVEQITFKISDSEHWNDGTDFIRFWRTIRAKFQKLQGVFSYLISSTNPMSVERPYINNTDNPIFSHVTEYYIEQFSVLETKEMISVLGGYMGLKFDEELFAFINRDYGGHPLLIRHVCSEINSMATGQRPKSIKRVDYDKAKTKFENEKSKGFFYAEMILEILDKFYPDESTMLTSLAVGDLDFFYEFANESPEYTAHLLGYGIVEKNDNGEYDFKIDIIKRYLIEKENRKKRKSLSNNDLSQIEAPQKRAKGNIFISYSHQDLDQYKRLMVHLNPLIREEFINVWSDEQIQPGENWQRAIEGALKQATVAILLISADFMASKYISDVELPSLLIDVQEKGTTVIPFFLKPTVLNRFTNITQYQGINTPDKPYSSLDHHEQEALLAKLAEKVDFIFNQ
jgi:hypothetical protein